MKNKLEAVERACDKCGAPVKVSGTINISTFNPWSRYVGSNRPMIYRSSYRLCEKHFSEFEKKMKKLISDY